MERINLLPEEARMTFMERLLHTVDRDFPRVLAGACGAIVALGLVVSLTQGFGLLKGRKKVKALKEQINLLQVETQNMESFSKQLDQVQQELQRQKKMLDDKVAYLKTTQERPRIWALVLREMRRNIPHGVWLTEMETGPVGSLRVAGGATDENLVTDFMSSLKTSPHFSNVTFSYTQKESIGNVPIVKFEIVCRAS